MLLHVSDFLDCYLVSIVWIHHSLFTCSSIDGHLSCFHVLFITNRVSVNIFVNLNFYLLGKYSEVKLLGHTVVAYLFL